MKPRHKKLIAIAGGLAALGAAAALVLSAFQENLVFFFTPSQVAANEAPRDRTFRIGGLVEEGSVKREKDGLTVHFRVTDTAKVIPVVYTGILPDLFREGKGVVAQGRPQLTDAEPRHRVGDRDVGPDGAQQLAGGNQAARPFGELTGQALGVLFLKYGRDDELQADGLGAKYESTLGWDPAGVPAFLSTLGRPDEAAGDRRGVPNWLSTHPDPLSRVEDIQPVVAQFKASGANFVTNRDALWQRIDGMIYGDSPEQGFVRENVFLHPVLRFRIEFPDKWEVANSPQQVVAKAPGADVFMLLQGVQKPQGRDIREIALNDMAQAGFRAVDGRRTTINGLDAFDGVYQGQMEGLGPVGTRVAHIAHGKDIYLVAGIVAPNAFQQADRAFQASIRTFRPLSTAEAENIRPDRVDLYVVRAGDTWQSIAERSGGAVKPATLAVMNNASLGSQPQPGQRIKIVVRG